MKVYYCGKPGKKIGTGMHGAHPGITVVGVNINPVMLENPSAKKRENRGWCHALCSDLTRELTLLNTFTTKIQKYVLPTL